MSAQATAGRPRSLLVIVGDRISAFAHKGEVVDRYYNPGNLFDEVHLAMTNDDDPSPETVQRLVGDARPFVHNLPAGRRVFLRSFGWRPRALRGWCTTAVDLARDVDAQLVRCHGVHLNAFAASEIKRRLGIPYVISLHVSPSLDLRHHREGGWRITVANRATIALERAAIRGADCVVCVYRFIESYAREMGARRTEVIYNVVSATIEPKTDYRLNGQPRLILPGRQAAQKDPTPVLEALPEVPEAVCTLIGDGAMHERLKTRAEQLGVADRCRFLKSVPNDELCRTLKDHDILISINQYGGVSKVELEAALAGMPVITNDHPLESRPELLGESCVTVPGDAPSYLEAIRRLVGDAELRERLGRGARRAARGMTPEAMEQRYVDLYLDVLGRHEAEPTKGLAG